MRRPWLRHHVILCLVDFDGAGDRLDLNFDIGGTGWWNVVPMSSEEQKTRDKR